MTEKLGFPRASGLRRGPVEPLSPQAWQRVESAVFERLGAAMVPWSLAPEPLRSHAAPRGARPLRVHWATSVGLALVSAAAAAAALHWLRPPPAIEAEQPTELLLPAVRADKAAPEEQPALQASSPSGPVPLTRAAPLAHPLLPSAAARRAPVPTPAAGSDHRARLFERAARLESADAPRALELYRTLASGADAWAANALYAAARLELERGSLAAGAAHLNEYMARFPGGENSVDVHGLRQRLALYR